MKRRFVIHVDIDTNKSGISHMEYQYHWLFGRSVKIYLRDDIKQFPSFSKNPDKITIAALLHELGHVVGQVFHTEGAMADPRIKGVDRSKFTPEQDKLVIDSEKEAWTLADAMYTQTRKWAIESYEKPKLSLPDLVKDMFHDYQRATDRSHQCPDCRADAEKKES